MDHSHDSAHGSHDSHGSVFKRIIVPFIILTVITLFEFLIAFTMDKGTAKVVIFVLLTFMKAFYIIGYFMHVKFERVNFIYTVTLPFIFVIYLLILLFMEGGYQHTFSYG